MAQSFIKQTAEVKTFSIDFTPVLGTGELINNGNIVVTIINTTDGSSASSLLDSGSTSLTGNTIFFRITGGVNNEIYKITVNTGLTNASNKHEEDLILIVSDDVNLLYTVDELKVSLGITNTAQDALLFGLIKSASDYIANAIDRKLDFSSYTETFYLDCPQDNLLLKQYPVVSITGVLIDGVTLPSSSQGVTTWYFTEDGSINRIDGFKFPIKPIPITVTYKAGYRVMPEDIRAAVKKVATGEYTFRKKAGVLAETIGNYRVVFLKEGIYSDPYIKDVITRYKRLLV